MKKIISLLLTLLLLLTCYGCKKEEKKISLTEVYDYVFDVGTYEELDYDYAAEFFKSHNDNWGGGCSAIAKVLDDGTTIVGRNMDLNISNKAAYIFRTDVKDCYPTINLAYTFRDYSPDYKVVKEKGLPEDFAKLLPFIADDVLNSEGLYVEVNMRNGEFWPTGEAKFSCSGTNPSSDTRVYMFELTRYIGEHCASVDEAIEYVRTLDVYSQDGYWNYCFLMADKTGHYGVLEFASNQVIWNDYAQSQTNFYLDPLVNYAEELKAGVGRYNTLMAGIDNVKSEEDMFNLIDSVSYFQVYDPYNCKFDVRGENVGVLPFATYDLLMAEENREFVMEGVEAVGSYVRTLNRQELQDANEYWESSFTEVINCNERSLFVRFFEDDNRTIKLTFDENE